MISMQGNQQVARNEIESSFTAERFADGQRM